MTRSLKIFLLLLIAPSMLMCMNQEAQSLLTDSQIIIYKTITPIMQQEMDTIYNNAIGTIPKVQSKDDNSVSLLLTLMENVHSFTSNNAPLDEHYLGTFAHTKNPLPSFFKTGTPPQIALFFNLLKNYHKNITSDNLVTPRFIDWIGYKKNKSLPTDQAITIGALLGISIKKENINTDKPPFIEVAKTAAIQHFIKLIENIEKMVNITDQTTLQHLADLIYLNHAQTITAAATMQ